MFEERSLLPGGFVLEARVAAGPDYALRLWKGGTLLVEYGPADGRDFKSVEKLRYDFQRDVEDALRQG